MKIWKGLSRCVSILLLFSEISYAGEVVVDLLPDVGNVIAVPSERQSFEEMPETDIERVAKKVAHRACQIYGYDQVTEFQLADSNDKILFEIVNPYGEPAKVQKEFELFRKWKFQNTGVYYPLEATLGLCIGALAGIITTGTYWFVKYTSCEGYLSGREEQCAAFENNLKTIEISFGAVTGAATSLILASHKAISKWQESRARRLMKNESQKKAFRWVEIVETSEDFVPHRVFQSIQCQGDLDKIRQQSWYLEKQNPSPLVQGIGSVIGDYLDSRRSGELLMVPLFQKLRLIENQLPRANPSSSIPEVVNEVRIDIHEESDREIFDEESFVKPFEVDSSYVE